MNGKVKDAFNQIHAEEALKDSVRSFLAEKTVEYAHMPAESVRARRAGRGYLACAAACACMLCVLLGGRWLYFTPVTVISIDINPSLELDVNRFGRVVDVKGFNEDGRSLAALLDIKFKNYSDAVEEILLHDEIAGLLSGDEIMTITVVGQDGEQTSRMLSNLQACAEGHRNTYCYSASHEEVADAHEMGLSCGKYSTFLKMQALDPNITPESLQDMTMREIRDLYDTLSDGEGWESDEHWEGDEHSGWTPGSSGISAPHGGHHGGGW